MIRQSIKNSISEIYIGEKINFTWFPDCGDAWSNLMYWCLSPYLVWPRRCHNNTHSELRLHFQRCEWSCWRHSRTFRSWAGEESHGCCGCELSNLWFWWEQMEIYDIYWFSYIFQKFYDRDMDDKETMHSYISDIRMVELLWHHGPLISQGPQMRL